MRRWLTSIVLSAVIAVAIAVAVAGCGSQKRTIPTKTGQSFLKQLDTIGSQVDNGACVGAQAKVDALANQVNSLPRSVDTTVKRNLEDGVQRLATLVRSDCQRQTPTNTTPTTTVPSVPTTPTATVPTTPNTVPTTPNTVPTTPNTVPTTPNTTPTTAPTTPGGGGGGVSVPGSGVGGETP